MAASFTEIKRYLVEKLREFDSFKTSILYHGVYSRILDVFSYNTEKDAYYAEFLLKESSINTATTIEAIKTHAEDRQYKAHRKKGAIGTVKVSADSTFAVTSPLTYTGFGVFIPKYTQIIDENNENIVYTTEDVLYPSNIVIVNKSIDATTAVNFGGGKVGLPVTAHGMPIGQTVSVRDTLNYDGDYIIESETTTNEIVITTQFISENFSGSEKVSTGNTYINIKEGELREYIYTAKGFKNEKITIFSDSVDNDTIEAYKIDEEGSVISQVIFTEEPYLENDLVNYVAEVINDTDFKTTSLKFGNGLQTRRLQDGERFKIIYADTKGDEGDIVSSGILTQFKDDLLDSQGNVASIYVTNDDSIAGGSDYEDKESIRANSTSLFQAGYRLANNNDWVTTIKTHPSVVNAVVWTNVDLDETSQTINSNVIYVSAVSSTGENLTVSQQSDLSLNFLKVNRDPTVYLKFLQLAIVELGFDISGKINKVNIPDVENNISEALVAQYDILNTDFGPDYSIYDSSFTTLIKEVPDVIYHNTIIYHLEKSTNFSTVRSITANHVIVVSQTATDESDPEKQIFLQNSTVDIYLKRKINGTWYAKKQIGQTNAGDDTVLEGINNYTLSGGTINYTTNSISFNIDDIISDTIPAGEPDSDASEITTVQTVADVSGSLNNKYFYISSTTTDYYVWYNVSGGGTDPSISGKTGIQVAITTNSSANTVASNTQSVIDALGAFTATVLGSTVTITVDTAGTVTDASDINTGFTLETTQQGTASNSFGVVNPSNSDLTGYVVIIQYKTKNGNGEFLNDVRLPHFYNITDIDTDDIIYTLEF